MERRLAAVLAADMVGYSRLMEADEEGTITRQRAHRSELIDPLIADHGGRIVKTTGDGLLIEFPSVVDAVSCAVAIQRAMAEREAEVPEDRRIRYRVGINLGDIVIDGDDILGDGVNVAARLEGLAQPGGICIPRKVMHEVRTKLDVGFEFTGEQKVKNIATAVPVYRVLLEPEAAGKVIGETRRTQSRWLPAAAVAAIAVVAGGAIWWQPWAPKVEPASIERMAFPLPEKPSIAVLPFDNISEDTSQEFFADGMTEDMITDLSKIPELFVIARNSAFVYKGRAVPVRQVAEELGVRYVLEGSVRRVGDQVRINAQLIDATTGGHLWADRYDGSLGDVFGLQDEVTQHVVAALAVELALRAQARPETASAEAYDSFLRGWAYYRRGSIDDYAKAIPHFEKAVELDPDYNRAHAALAAIYWTLTDKGEATGASTWWTSLGIVTADALELEQKYLGMAMERPVVLAHWVASGRLARQARYDEAVREAGRAIALDSNDPIAHEAMAIALVYSGKSSEAADAIRRALRLDPQRAQDYLYWLGLAEFGMERYEDAVATLTKATQSIPDDDRSLIVLTASYGHLGRAQEARATLERVNALRLERKKHLEDPIVKQQLEDAGFAIGVDVFLPGPYTQKDVDFWPFKEAADRARLREGLRLAGVPATGAAENVSPIEVPGAVTVDPVEAKELLDRGAVFVDVRGDGRWEDGHIPGSVSLGLVEGFSEQALSQIVAKDREVVIYCMGPRCLRSSKACAMAVSWGFEKVYYLREGLPGWKAAGYPIEVGE
jgi:TolB-like protein/class 3 adenylate cyclase/rhodanese-related sulfurtransferase